ncbi:MAG: aminotransferase class I/II-fold pyridoxal phosphate-dependent enzyme, partial [Acidimicrobiales bacterium]
MARALVDPGATVGLADPGYVGAIQAFGLSGARWLALPGDTDGLAVDVLEERLRGGTRPALVYVVPNFHNPTGATLSLERRVALGRLSDHYGFVIVEDDPYRELRWAGPTLPSLGGFADQVVTLGSFSKTLCPGLR